MGDVAPNQVNTLIAVNLVIEDRSPEATPTKVVGQKVILRVVAPGRQALQAIRWTIPGNPVRHFELTSRKSTFAQLDTNERVDIELHWTHGGTHQVRVDADVEGRPASGTATFTVAEPTASLDATMNNTVTLGAPPAPGPSIRYGEYNADKPGIKWSASATGPAGFDGEIMVVQLIMSKRVWTMGSGMFDALEVATGGNYYNDATPGSIPYNDRSAALGALETATLSALDAPGVGLWTPELLTQVTIDEHFFVYLLYRPKLKGAIYVPLRRLAWGWNASVWRPEGTQHWTKRGPSKAATNQMIMAPVSERTAIYPVYVGNYREMADLREDLFMGGPPL